MQCVQVYYILVFALLHSSTLFVSVDIYMCECVCGGPEGLLTCSHCLTVFNPVLRKVIKCKGNVFYFDLTL